MAPQRFFLVEPDPDAGDERRGEADEPGVADVIGGPRFTGNRPADAFHPSARAAFHDILPTVKRVEIGYTWYAKSVQRTHVNTTAKLLMMGHAFDTLGCHVVGWRTDNFNFASQRAIERLGAKKDGVIRGHALRRDGTIRDTVMYSMRAGEWPEAKAQLLYLLERHALA